MTDDEVEPVEPERTHLPMKVFLLAYASQGELGVPSGWELLENAGYPLKVVYRKAEKAASKGYYDYGVSPKYGWLTAKGERFLLGEENVSRAT